MAFFDIFKKKDYQKSTTLSNVSSTKNVPQLKLTIHSDLDGLVWIGDGTHKNYESKNNCKNSFEVDGFKISITLMPQEEPSLIFTKQKINKPIEECSINRPSYYPTYSELSPEQKWIYLQLLLNPYDPNIDIGYVFILYYGLERHLLHGSFEAAFKLILNLRDVHTNKSFQSYSANALVLTSMLHKRGDLALEFIKSIDKEYELAFSDNLFLICYYSFDMPLLPKDIMRMAKSFEFTNTNYIKKYPNIFEECLADVINAKLGTGKIDIKKYITKTELRKIKMQNVNIFANVSIREKTIPIPLLTENFKFKKEVNAFLETAHERVKAKLAEMRKSGQVLKPVTQKNKKNVVLDFDVQQEKELLSELAKNKSNLVDRHFCYIQLQDFYYKYRHIDKLYIDKCIQYCWLDINSLSEMQNEYITREIQTIKQLAPYHEAEYESKETVRIKEEGFIGSIPAFSRLVIIFEKQGEYELAMDICARAISYGQGTESFNERKEKLQKKLNNKIQKQKG